MRKHFASDLHKTQLVRSVDSYNLKMQVIGM